MKKFFVTLLAMLLLAGACCGIAALSTVDGVSGLEREIMQGYAKAEIPADAKSVGSAGAFTAMVSNGTYYLTADIEVSASYSALFKGTLYGNGHTVTLTGQPLFTKISGGAVYDLTLAGAVSTSADYVGALASSAVDADLVGVVNKASVHNSKKGAHDTTRREGYTGGLVGYAESTTFKYCVNNGAVSGHTTESRLGGFVGLMDPAFTGSSTVETAFLTFENCVNHGSVTGINQTGGFLGRVFSGKKVTVKDCANFGTVTVTYSDGGGFAGKMEGTAELGLLVEIDGFYNTARIDGATFTGGMVGIMGNVSNLTLVDCHNGCYLDGCVCDGSNHGYITNHDGSGDQVPIGGLIGQLVDEKATVSITDCSNSGDIAGGGKWRTGGIAAVMEGGDVTVKNCTNSGNITSKNYVGGLFGRVGAARTENDITVGVVTLEGCSNSGNLTTTSYAGGMIGYQQYAGVLKVIDCHNTGTITTGWNAGGLLARTDNARTACTMTFENCSNVGDIISNGTAGGITGIMTGTTDLIRSLSFTDCTNKGDIIVPNYAGGISGIADVHAYTATNCRNEGTINVVNQNEHGNVGGIAGRTYGVTLFEKCVNVGDILTQKVTFAKSTTGTNLYVGGIVGWVGRSGTSYKDHTATLNYCINTGDVVAKDALRANQIIVTGGIVGVSRSQCTAKECISAGDVCSSMQVGGIAALCSQNEKSGSTFENCLVSGNVYCSGAKTTDRSQGAAGIVCYTWGDCYVDHCTVLGDIQLDVSGDDLAADQRRGLAALVGYTNNAGGMLRNNFFAGRLISGEGTNCTKVMVANFVNADVSGDIGNDISNNYSVHPYTLYYCTKYEWSKEMTPELTEEEIAAGVTLADKAMVDTIGKVKIVTCLGVEAPIFEFMLENYEMTVDLVGHRYEENCNSNCSVCGREKVIVKHVYNHDCDVDCNLCGADREIEHTYGAWITAVPATETTLGRKEHTCEVCGHKESAEIPLVEAKPPVVEGGANNEKKDGGVSSFMNAVGLDGLVTAVGAVPALLICVGAVLLVVILITALIIVVIKKSKKKNETEQ